MDRPLLNVIANFHSFQKINYKKSISYHLNNYSFDFMLENISKNVIKSFLTVQQVQIYYYKMANNVNVMVRVRPLLRHENQPAWMAKQNSLIALHSHSRFSKISSNEPTPSSKQAHEVQHEFNFQSIVPENESSQQLYKKYIKPTLLECLQSHRNISIMAYGQTCSGKTHTILGIKDAPGIIPCVLRQLFRSTVDKNYRMKISYLEIYNQKLRDLLDKKNVDKQMKIIEDAKWNCDVSGALKEPIKSFEESIKILEKGEKDRQYGQGQRHERSSRSHTLFRIFVEEWDNNFNSKALTITIVDLAGSERLASSSQSISETAFINKSLFQLANVISKLAELSQHIPYRDSKLTRILEPSLSGNGRTMLICCVSPSTNCYGETLSTLRLAERAKKIKLPEEPLEFKEESIEALKEKLRQKNRECSQLKNQIESLRQKIAKQEEQISKLKNQSRTNTGAKGSRCDMLILLDHENFTLFLGDSLQEQILESSKTAKIKDEFICKMQELYEKYTQEILQLCNGDRFELRIQEICFMNMVLQHQRIAEYRLVVIDELLKEKQEKIDQENHQFYKALGKYRSKLAQEIPHTSVSFALEELQQRQDSNYKKIDISKYNSAQLLGIGTKQKEYASQLLVWGSKKDYRVCKGQSYKLNMTRIASIKNIASVACGYHHTLVVTAQGKLFGWGKNTQRQLLPCSKESISSAIEIETVGKVRSVAAGWGHTLIVTSQGRAYSWGYGKDGQLGLGTTQNELTPTQIEHQLQIITVFAGHSHSAFLDINKDLYFFGFNQDYRLMIGDEKIVLTPRRISIRDVKSASLGVSHSAIVTESGLVYCGGVGTHGELGVDLNETHFGWEKLEVADRQFENEPYEKICPLVQVDCFSLKRKALEVKCGQSSTFVLTDTGELWSFGKSVGGRTGHKSPLPKKILEDIDIFCTGCRHGLAYNSKQRKLYSWGFNLYGQANPSISGDISSPELMQQMDDKRIVGVGSGFFHSILLLK